MGKNNRMPPGAVGGPADTGLAVVEPPSIGRWAKFKNSSIGKIAFEKLIGWTITIILLILVLVSTAVWRDGWEWPRRIPIMLMYLLDGEIGPSDFITGLIGRGDYRVRRIVMPISEGRHEVSDARLVLVIDLPDPGELDQLFTVDDHTGMAVKTGNYIFKKVEVLYRTDLGEIDIYTLLGPSIEYWQPAKPQEKLNMNCSIEVEWFLPWPSDDLANKQQRIAVFLIKSRNLDATRPPCPI